MTASHPASCPRRACGATALLALALQACVVVPQTREVYDPECKVMKREMTLQTATIGSFQGCADDACKALLVTMGVVTAATAVVSGSVALVGNVLYWIEGQGQCLRARPAPSGAASAPPSAPSAFPPAN